MAPKRRRRVTVSDSDDEETHAKQPEVKKEVVEKTPASPNSSPLSSPPPSENSVQQPISPPAPTHNEQPSANYSPTKPNPALPAQQPTESVNPFRSPTSPQIPSTEPKSPHYSPTSPEYSSLSPTAGIPRDPPTSPKYCPPSPNYNPVSPKHSPNHLPTTATALQETTTETITSLDKCPTSPAPANMATDMNERAIEFEAETAERRADLREANEVNSTTLAENRKDPNSANTDGAMDVDVHQTAFPATFTPAAKTNGVAPAPLNSGLNSQNHITQNSEATKGSQIPITNASDGGDGLKSTDEQNEAPKVATLADAILDEVKLSGRTILTKGDAAVIVDESDLTKTLLLPVQKLASVAPNILNINRTAHFTTTIKHVFVLKCPNDRDGLRMLLLSPTDPTEAIIAFRARQHKPHTRARAAAEEAKIKQEGEVAPEEEDEAVDNEMKTDWTSAWTTALAMITGVSRTKIFTRLSQDAQPLLPQIQGVIAIAEQYDALLRLEDPLERLIKDLMEKRTLWPSIADRPVAWLMIGLAVKDKMIYKEALTHLIGSYPECADRMREANVPQEIQDLVHSRSERLKYQRMAVDMELLTLHLAPRVVSKAKHKDSLDHELASYRPNSVAFLTLSRWREHITSEIRRLEPDADEAEEDQEHNPNAKFNLSVAGFYQSIHNGGDSYLPADEFVDEWPRGWPDDETKVREMLKRLKSVASAKVADLNKSTLQYERKDKMEYLTCIEIEETEIPWAKDDDDGND